MDGAVAVAGNGRVDDELDGKVDGKVDERSTAGLASRATPGPSNGLPGWPGR